MEVMPHLCPQDAVVQQDVAPSRNVDWAERHIGVERQGIALGSSVVNVMAF